MPDDNAGLIRSVYGFNWAAVEDRGRGLAAARAVMVDDVQARISPEVGERTLRGVEDFAVFVQGLEEDFSEFRYQAEESRSSPRSGWRSADTSSPAAAGATCRSARPSGMSGRCATEERQRCGHS